MLRANRRRAFTEILAFTLSVNNAEQHMETESRQALLFSSVFFVYLFLSLSLTALVVFSDYVHSFRLVRNGSLVCSYFIYASSPSSHFVQKYRLLTIILHLRGIHVNESRSRGWLSANHHASRQEFRAVFFSRGTKILSQFISATFLST